MSGIGTPAKLFLLGVAFASAAGLAVFFRLYPLKLRVLQQQESSQRVASAVVYNAIKQQMKALVDTEFPGMAEGAKWELAERKAQDAVKAEVGQFQEAVLATASSMRKSDRSQRSKPYLLEADPYYYFHLTRNIERFGHISRDFRGGKFFDELRLYPQGAWARMTWHPYVGYTWYRLLRLWKPQMELMTALSFLPIVLSTAAIALFLAVCWSMTMGLFESWIGSVILGLSPIFLQRSAFGWYDTDPYNYVFPLLALLFYFRALRPGGRCWPEGLLAGFVTGLYSFFWYGWPFLFVVMAAASAGGTVAQRLIERRWRNESFRFGAAYIASSLACALAFLTPVSFYESFREGWMALLKFARVEGDLWPNIFLTVGEAGATSITKLIFLTGNYATAAWAGAGLSGGLIMAWKERRPHDFYRWLVLAMMIVPLVAMTLRTERFAVLVVLPLSLFVVLGVKAARRLLARFVVAPVVFLVLFFLCVPFPVVHAHVVASRILPIMDDTWYESLAELSTRTPENAVVHSWWPPGHFITGVAGRRVSIDGATQHLPAAYWVARAFLSPEEREAAGIFRMIHGGGNDALEHLEKRGMDLANAIALLLTLVPLPREEAKGLLPEWMDEEEKARFLDQTHGATRPLSTYVLLYNDMIEQNLAMAIVARWDFRKAAEVRQESARKRAARRRDFSSRAAAWARRNLGAAAFYGCAIRAAQAIARGALGLPGQKIQAEEKSYLDEVLEISHGILKYTPEAKLEKREGDTLFFANGLMVNLPTWDAMVAVVGKGVMGRPLSLFYIEDGRLIEKMYEGERIDSSALVIERNGEYSSVLADRELIRSMLFRLYYLRGEGLQFFRPFSSRKDPLMKTEIDVYELDWDAFVRKEAT